MDIKQIDEAILNLEEAKKQLMKQYESLEKIQKLIEKE